MQIFFISPSHFIRAHPFPFQCVFGTLIFHLFAGNRYVLPVCALRRPKLCTEPNIICLRADQKPIDGMFSYSYGSSHCDRFRRQRRSTEHNMQIDFVCILFIGAQIEIDADTYSVPMHTIATGFKCGVYHFCARASTMEELNRFSSLVFTLPGWHLFGVIDRRKM